MRTRWLWGFILLQAVVGIGCNSQDSVGQMDVVKLRELAGATTWLPDQQNPSAQLPDGSIPLPSFATTELLLDIHNDGAAWAQPAAKSERKDWRNAISIWREKAFDGKMRPAIASNEDVESFDRAIRLLVLEARLHGLDGDVATTSAILELASSSLIKALETAPGIRYRDLIPTLAAVLAELRCGDLTLHLGADAIGTRFSGKEDFRNLATNKIREEFAIGGVNALLKFHESDDQMQALAMQLAAGQDSEKFADTLNRITSGLGNFFAIEDTARLSGSWIDSDLRFATGEISHFESHVLQIERLILKDWGADPYEVPASAWDTVDMESRLKQTRNAGGILIAYGLHRAVVPLIESAYVTQIDIDIARLKSARAANIGKLRSEAKIHRNPLTGKPYELNDSGQFLNLNCQLNPDQFPILAAMCANDIKF